MKYAEHEKACLSRFWESYLWRLLSINLKSARTDSTCLVISSIIMQHRRGLSQEERWTKREDLNFMMDEITATVEEIEARKHILFFIVD